MENFFLLIVFSGICITIWMTILWGIYLIQRKANIADVGWGVGFILTIALCILFGRGEKWRLWLLGVMVFFWALRLVSHLLNRLQTEQEDPRYATIRENWRLENTDYKFWQLFFIQGMLIVAVSLPFFVVAVDTRSSLSIWHLFAFTLWIIALTGEAVADAQLSQFRKYRANRTEVCETGLWKYSRHPNYFFEWLIWVSFAIFAFPSPGGIIAFISPAIMYYLLTQVSGIPLVEEEALKSKGDAYKQYQQTTPAFFPWNSK